MTLLLLLKKLRISIAHIFFGAYFVHFHWEAGVIIIILIL